MNKALSNRWNHLDQHLIVKYMNSLEINHQNIIIDQNHDSHDLSQGKTNIYMNKAWTIDKAWCITRRIGCSFLIWYEIYPKIDMSHDTAIAQEILDLVWNSWFEPKISSNIEWNSCLTLKSWTSRSLLIITLTKTNTSRIIMKGMWLISPEISKTIVSDWFAREF